YPGGTNFGRTTCGPFVATSYDYDAPLDEYDMIFIYLSILFCFCSLSSHVVVYKIDNVCAAFLANINTTIDVIVNFSGNLYQLPTWSVNILPDYKNIVFNTAKVCLIQHFNKIKQC
ncbi:hypothetical protein HN51_055295, partial [Arachis hypogaea]